MNKKIAPKFAEYIGTHPLDDLPTDARTLFGLLALIIDIEYRRRHSDDDGAESKE